MTESIKNMILLGGIFLLLFTIAEILYRKWNCNAEVTRKIVHIASGIITLFFPAMLGNHWLVLILCTAFLILLVASMRWNLLPSINGVNRTTVGSILFPITVCVCYFIAKLNNNFTLYFIPILILSICDPIAAFVGKRWPWKKFTSFKQTKTISGSIAFLISATITSLFLFAILFDTTLPRAFLLALVVGVTSSFTEGISHGGYDNISIPISVIIVILIFQNLQLL